MGVSVCSLTHPYHSLQGCFPSRLVLKSDFGEGLSPALAFDLSFEPVLSKSEEQKRVLVHFCFALSFFLFFSLLVLFDAFFQQAINLLCPSLFCLYCWTSWTRPNWVILPPSASQEGFITDPMMKCSLPTLLSSCHSSLLSSCSNLIYLPPESIIFVVCATLRESTFESQHCLTRCVLKASIHALNEACCFSSCLK